MPPAKHPPAKHPPRRVKKPPSASKVESKQWKSVPLGTKSSSVSHTGGTTTTRLHPPIQRDVESPSSGARGTTSPIRSTFEKAFRMSIVPPPVVNKPSKTLLIIWMLVGCELLMDLISTIISFAALMNDFECCGETVDYGGLVLGIAIPFFLLIMVELGALAWNIKHSLYDSETAVNTPQAEEGLFDFLGSRPTQRWINGLLIFNPFFGFMVAWMLLYESNKSESLAVLALEAISLVLHYISIYLEGQKQTKVSLAIYSLPLIPFFVTIIVIIVYLNIGGVCYLVEKQVFWYKGCHVCDDGTRPSDHVDGLCPGGTEGEVGEYCSLETNFCWFSYS